MSGARANLLGAQGARELIAFLEGGGDRTIELRPDPGARARLIRLTRPTDQDTTDHPTGPTRGDATAGQDTTTERASGRLLDRHVFELAPDPRRPVRAAPPAVPPDAVVLTNASGYAAQFAAGRGDGASAHVRVIVDATDPRLRAARWSQPVEDLLDLHERTFMKAKECAPHLDGGSFVVSVVGGVTEAGVPLPFTGLFTGLVKSLALEFPGADVLATVHQDVPLDEVLATVSAELGARRLIPVTYHAGGLRLTPRAVPTPAPPSEVPPLGPDTLVVAAGGARGIGAPILEALAARHRPRLVVLGSSELPDEAGEELDRSAFIRAQVRQGASVPEANARFDRLGEARQVRRTLAGLERLCGPGRVRYLRCDLRDGAAVERALAAVDGPIDLLLNIAGTNRASGVAAKSVADFRTVRDLKVRAYLNLKEATRGREPRLWCNFGSFIGLTGQRGETDYGAANDFLTTSAMNASGEFTIGWTLWRDIGLGATPLMRDFLEGSGEFTPTPTEEGVEHFMAELAAAPDAPVTVFFGDKERAAIRAAVPEFLEFSAEAQAQTRPLPYIDRVLRRDGAELVAERTFSMDRDGYLDLHQVRGYPTLPGTFVPELAAQAAVALVPGRVPVVFEDLRLESFLRIYRADRPEVKRLTARLLRADERESVVAVQVLGDVVAPNGVTVARDRVHFSVTVRLRDAPVPGPAWTHWDEHGSRPLRDPYHVPGSEVLLREVFASTTGTRTHPLGRRGRLALDAPALRRWFPDLLVPSVTLDGLVRVAVLERVAGRWTPVAIPRSIRRIDLYGGHTDLTLAALTEPVELYVTPVDLDLEDPEPDNRAIAVASSGEVLLQVKDIIGAVVGYVDQETGEYVDRERFDREERP
ncbi:KR domain-containing protein [Nonomuraea jabiensis]|uniref:NAD(P)-dependent dehydrogenase (Short-subunit alcohol dehydrogenase family) n=1 Tax=Nonomuraea jabiensis TaxID=882448 RepID=A0A7W9GCX3_9ACTN|nr:KR domain-containing protein [Nonomuraea jabiensis]MBB5781475.1 NAD(P)-dependent dehydrogenase (short-subunit alcohol dehydrogenase family) [Nonomuraea jabiensis]